MPNRFKSSGNLPWTCDVCDREMHENSMSAHLAGKDHARKTLTKSTIEPVKPSIGTGASLSSESASPIDQKARLCCSKSNSINSIEDGPLDYFFHSYPSFRYDHRLSPAISFKLLRAHLQKRRGWKFKGSKDRQLWCRYQDSLKQEFEVWFGDDDEMEAWHRLCRAIRISPLPATIALCRKVGCPISSFLRSTFADAWIGCTQSPC